ncbi:hypothetical protein HMPREF3037_03122 [Candidatus Stoquefichus sp. KLE1796]|nr:hypothetical protein HMPREF3037_03122 [Candidatus Stoquefichus sp. KLE1796]
MHILEANSIFKVLFLISRKRWENYFEKTLTNSLENDNIQML